MKIIAHTMEYRGGSIVSPLRLRNYSAFDYEEYKRIYEECFRDMRTALQRFPVDCCDSKEELEHKKDKIYILEIDGKLVGSVAIYDNEIDDLIVGKSYQRAVTEKRYCRLLFLICKVTTFLQLFCMLRIGIREQLKCI